MLYDGFATRNEVKRLDHAGLVRALELLDTSDNIALEAARAYYDVLRYQNLYRLLKIIISSITRRLRRFKFA